MATVRNISPIIWVKADIILRFFLFAASFFLWLGEVGGVRVVVELVEVEVVWWEPGWV